MHNILIKSVSSISQQSQFSAEGHKPNRMDVHLCIEAHEYPNAGTINRTNDRSPEMRRLCVDQISPRTWQVFMCGDLEAGA